MSGRQISREYAALESLESLAAQSRQEADRAAAAAQDIATAYITAGTPLAFTVSVPGLEVRNGSTVTLTWHDTPLPGATLSVNGGPALPLRVFSDEAPIADDLLASDTVTVVLRRAFRSGTGAWQIKDPGRRRFDGRYASLRDTPALGGVGASGVFLVAGRGPTGPNLDVPLVPEDIGAATAADGALARSAAQRTELQATADQKADRAQYGQGSGRGALAGLAAYLLNTDAAGKLRFLLRLLDNGTLRVGGDIVSDAGIVRAPGGLSTANGDVIVTSARAPWLIAETDTDANGTQRVKRAVHPNPPPQQQLRAQAATSVRTIYPGGPITDTDEAGRRRVRGYYLSRPQTEAVNDLVAAGGVDGILAAIGGDEYIPPDDIRAFAPDIVMDGTTDQSTQLKAAHDAARTAGHRIMYIEGPIRADTAINLGDVLFFTRSGRGRLVGTYRKRVVPVGAPSISTPVDVVPATHLARWNAAVEAATPTSPAVLVYMSDSWGQPNQLIGLQSQLEEQLWRMLRAQYGSKALDGSIAVINRAIGAQTWNNAASLPNVQSWPAWYTNQAAPWLDYVTTIDLTALGYTHPGASTARPHLVLLMFGMNHGTPPTAQDITDATTVCTTLEAISPRPDICMIAVPSPSSQSTIRGTKAAQEARRAFAGFARAVAATRGYGLLDLARVFDGAHWGRDPVLTYFERAVAADTAINLGTGYTFPAESTDFAFQFTATGIVDSAFWTTGDGQFVIPLSATAGNNIIIDRDSGTGRLAITINSATGVPFLPRTVTTAIAGGGTGGTFHLSVRGPDLLVTWRSVRLFRGPLLRGSSLFVPTAGFGGGASVSVTANVIAIAREPVVTPYMTDFDMWGGAGSGGIDGASAGTVGDIGGNDENHLSEPGRAELFSRVLLSTNWR